ncbi:MULTISPECIES: GNAT family N-acetyltransferase [unclassified Streptomyces]|uniref:GNAT family N-acetyltransferase n=1 Tax=unclassified Streptomyces TaxID=2593676 RepID=UPI0037F99938
MERPRPVIECGDVALRRWRGQRDFSSAHQLIEESVDHLSPWEPWVALHGEENTRGFLAKSGSGWAGGRVYNYAVTEHGTLVGMCQAYRGADPTGWFVGYWLHPSATGRGIATRATAALISEMFTLPAVRYLEIAHDSANTASAAIPRRLGFTVVRRELAAPPTAPSGTGIEVIWRLYRPAPPAGGAPRP